MVRLTNTEKWRDSFFYALQPNDKLLFIFLYENCNMAGILDVNYGFISDLTKLTKEQISSGLNNIRSKFVVNSDKSKIWLKNFLLHQNILPLNVKTDDGAKIKIMLQNSFEDFGSPECMKNIIDATVTKKLKKDPNKFTKPTVEEVINYFKTTEFNHIPESEITKIWDYYEGVGWKVGKKQMVDWVASFRRCFRNNKYNNRSASPNLFSQDARMTKIVEANEKLTGFDYNSLIKK